jgi:uncharacterized protein DUF3891
MVLYPLTDGEIPTGQAAAPIPAWQAVEKKQRQAAKNWWLVAQPDHAALAGDLAANLNSPLFPPLDRHVIRAIALHDAGWAQFDGGQRGTGRDLAVVLGDPKLDTQGRPRSFLEMTPGEFLMAWTDSIVQAEQAAPIGGLLVSRHFCRLAENRLESWIDNPGDTNRLNQFIQNEAERQEHLLEHDPGPPDQVRVLTDVLQFCDLLSLYLCCGAVDAIEFPQKFGRHALRLKREGEMHRLEPAIFGPGVSLGVTARRYPLSGAVEVTVLPFLLS